MDDKKIVFEKLRQVLSLCQSRFIVYENPISNEVRIFTEPTQATEPNPNVNNFYILEGKDVTDLIAIRFNKFTPNGVFDPNIWREEVMSIKTSYSKFPAHFNWVDIS